MARPASGGFTFIEVLQAMVIASIGLLALSSLTMATISANAKARRITTAATFGEAKMEDLRRTPYAAIAEGSDEVTQAPVTYSRAWTVCTSCPVDGAKQVTLTVRWEDRGTQTVKLETVIAR
jgi:prepilin-type N-terminal cleavage/methylation domain-containing protein